MSQETQQPVFDQGLNISNRSLHYLVTVKNSAIQTRQRVVKSLATGAAARTRCPKRSHTSSTRRSAGHRSGKGQSTKIRQNDSLDLLADQPLDRDQ